MPGIVYTNYRQSQVITGGRLLRWKNCELIDTMPDNSVVLSVSASDIRRSNIVALTHTESRMLFADADSLRISPREARSLIEQAEKRQKDAQNADKKAADMLAEYERRKGILNTRLSELEKKGGAALAVLDAQQARLLEQQTRNDRAISEARNKLSSVTESLNTARNALTRAEQQLM